MFIHLKYTALEKLIEDRNISRDFITNSVGRWPCQSRRPTWKFYIFAPKSSQTMSPQIKLYLLYYFPIMHFDASTKFQIWWCTFFAEVPKTTLAGCIEHLGGFVSWHQNRVWIRFWRSWLCIWSGFRCMVATLHSGVYFHHSTEILSSCTHRPKYGACCSISPKTSLRMAGLCSNLQ